MAKHRQEGAHRALEKPPAAPKPEGSIVALPAADGTSDAALVSRALRDDRWAKEAIYRRHVQHISRIILRLTRNRSEMEDVVQDTFIATFESLSKLRDGNNLRGYLSQIALNRVRRMRRRQRLLCFFGFDRTEDTPLYDTLKSVSVSGEDRAEIAKLDSILARLPDEQQLAWMLHYVDHESHEQVALACSCSVATVKRYVAAADAHVRFHMKDGGA